MSIFSWGKNQHGQLGDNTKYSTLIGMYPDDFEDGVIADYWTQNDLGGGGSFTEAASAGYLTITAGAGNCSSSTFTPTMLYQIVNESDFRITAKMYHVDTINQNYEQAGLLVTPNPITKPRAALLRIVYNSTYGKYANCAHFLDGSNINRNFNAVDHDLINASPIWFRIERIGETITCYISTDGIDFTDVNPQDEDGNTAYLLETSEPLYVGLWAAQAGSGNPFNVSFSDFDVIPLSGADAVETVGDLNFIDIAGGRNNSLGLNYEGKLFAWGDNTYGQLGDGTNISKSSPVAVQGNKRFIDVSSSSDHSMAIDSDGKLYAWGNNEYGQLGFIPPSGASVEELGEAGVLIESSQEQRYPFIMKGAQNQAGGILEKSTGQLWMWGNNSLGQLGINAGSNRTSPMSVVGNKSFVDMAGGSNWLSMGLDGTGQVWVWGYCANHHCGTGNTTNRSSPVTILPLPGGIKAMHPGSDLLCSSCQKQGLIAASSGEAFAIGEDGTLYGWGLNATGELGLGNGSGSRTSPVALPLWGKVGHVCADFDNTYTIGWSDNLLGREEAPDWGYRIRGFQTRGVLKSAGQGGDGKLGNWSTSTKSVPQLVCGPYESVSPQEACTEGWYVTHVDQGQQHACAGDIGKSGGKIFCWGDNTYGQLGNSQTGDMSHPVAVFGPTNYQGDWKDFACGRYHTCAIRASDGTAWCWGRGNVGQLGYGGVGNRSTPASVLGGHSFVAISCTYESTYALDSDGLLWGWGNIYTNFRNTSQTSPVSVIAVQGKTSPYFPADTVEYLLGYLAKQASPTEVGQFETAAAGLNHSLGIDNTGQVWAWGRNHRGQLGTGDFDDRSSPVAVIGLPSKRFVKVSAGAEHSLAMAEDGDVWGWGDNTFTQITTAAGSGDYPIGVGGGNVLQIPLDYYYDTEDIITPTIYTDFSNYINLVAPFGDPGIHGGDSTWYQGFFCKYGDHPFGTYCDGQSGDWEHGQAWEAGQWEMRIINPADYGTTNKLGSRVCRSKHSGSIDAGNCLANRVITDQPDQDILILVKVHGDESAHDFMGISARLSDDITSAGMRRYTFSLNHSNDGGVRMWKQNAGSFAVIGQNTVPATTAFCQENPGKHRCPGLDEDTQTYTSYPGYLWRNADWMWLRFRVIGTTLKGKAWPWGYDMPKGWDIEVTDSDIDGSAGASWGPYVSWGMLADTAGFFDFMAIAVGGKQVIIQPETTTETGSERPSPEFIGNFIDIDAGGYHNIALDDNYRPWTWGRNDSGQLGVNSLSTSASPTSVYGDHRFVDISAGEFHTYALKADGTICTWGAGDYGKLLFHGDESARSIPYCGSLPAVACVNQLPNTGNYEHSTLLRCGSTWQAWTWGCNDDGKLGDGTITNRSVPTSVLGNKKWIDLTGGGNFTLGLDEDGKIWAWGDDSLGQLGDG